MADTPIHDLTPYPQIVPPHEGEAGESGSSPHAPEAADSELASSVLVEFRKGPGMSPIGIAAMARQMSDIGFKLDEEYEMVPMAEDDTVVIRGWVDAPGAIARLESRSDVVKVWRDGSIAPF